VEPGGTVMLALDKHACTVYVYYCADIQTCLKVKFNKYYTCFIVWEKRPQYTCTVVQIVNTQIVHYGGWYSASE